MTYYIEIYEQRAAVFAVEADSEEDAINKVDAAYSTGTIELDNEDYEYVGYSSVKGKDKVDELMREGKITELPEEPTTYTVEYTLSADDDDGEPTDYICKVEKYRSVGEVKDESAEIIKGLIRDNGIPDGMYKVEMEITAVKGEEETHEDCDSMVAVVSDGVVTFRDDWGLDIPDKSDFFKSLSEDEQNAGYIKFNDIAIAWSVIKAELVEKAKNLGNEGAGARLFSLICEGLPDYSEGIIWSTGDEILVKDAETAEALADIIELYARANGEEITVNTGYYDPDEDKRNGEEDRHTGWHYVNMG